MKKHAKKLSGSHSLATSTKHRASTRRAARGRVLLEFPPELLERADNAAASIGTSRSELVRTAVEQYVDAMDNKRLEAELAEAYVANAAMSLELAQEFEHVDREGF